MALRLLPRGAAIRLALCVSATIVSICPPASAQPTAPVHATISLVAEDAAFQAGRTNWIGLLFEMEPGWHIYWVNPGDAGDPPRPKWELPAGFRAGDIRWPVPMRLVTGPVIDYGYEGRVLLALPLEVPADFKPSATAQVAADLRYLICRDVCVPGRTRVSLPTQPSGEASRTAGRREAFAEARARWPKAVPAGWEVKAATDGKQFTLTLQTGSREPAAVFYPLEGDQIDNAAPQAVTPVPKGAQVVLRRADADTKAPAVLRGVVVLGKDRAFEIAAPVTASPTRR
jgi:DsbC/DsbD-like thiol-disulfide interchange protein